MSLLHTAATHLATTVTLISSANAQCLRYEPDTVAITGVLARKTFPGPPNYESIQEGDEPETGFYLELSAPVCTVASADSANDNNGALHGIRLIQLVLDAAGYSRLRPQLRRQVTLRGTLFAALTGHHHAPLLLQVLWRP